MLLRLLLSRFVCRDRIGEQQKCSAAFLPAIPEDAVVYGAGDSSVILSKVRGNPLMDHLIRILPCAECLLCRLTFED